MTQIPENHFPLEGSTQLITLLRHSWPASLVIAAAIYQLLIITYAKGDLYLTGRLSTVCGALGAISGLVVFVDNIQISRRLIAAIGRDAVARTYVRSTKRVYVIEEQSGTRLRVINLGMLLAFSLRLLLLVELVLTAECTLFVWNCYELGKSTSEPAVAAYANTLLLTRIGLAMLSATIAVDAFVFWRGTPKRASKAAMAVATTACAILVVSGIRGQTLMPLLTGISAQLDEDSFERYIMYTPPSGGEVSVFSVALKVFYWSFSVEGTPAGLVGTPWTQPQGNFVNVSSFPGWAHVFNPANAASWTSLKP